MTGTIDLAFVDRADVKQYLGIPTVPAIYHIYSSCLNELIKVSVGNTINKIVLNDFYVLQAQIIKGQHLSPLQNNEKEESKLLLKICEQSKGLSGRSLRKIPFIAHALFLKKSFVSLKEFLEAIDKAVEKEKIERTYFGVNADIC